MGAQHPFGQQQRLGAQVQLPALLAAFEPGHSQIHCGRTDESGHEEVVRPLVQVGRVVHLLQHTVLEHGDPVSHRHGFDLVVSDVDGGGTESVLQGRDLGAHLHAQLGVQIG